MKTLLGFCLLAVCSLRTYGAQSVSIRKLPHGIRVAKTDSVKLVAAYWRLMILIKEPNLGGTYTQEVNKIDDYKTFVETAAVAAVPIQMAVKLHLLTRLDWLKADMEADNVGLDLEKD